MMTSNLQLVTIVSSVILGFVLGISSCETALACVIDDMFHGTDNNLVTVLILLDYFKALTHLHLITQYSSPFYKISGSRTKVLTFFTLI